MVTGRNKEQFEKWIITNRKDYSLVNSEYLAWISKGELGGLRYWNELPFEMQIGVYLSYYDSKGYVIDIMYSFVFEKYTFEVENKTGNLNLRYKENLYKTRNEAYKEAFKQADKIMNK